MKLYLITDNVDTAVGLRLAGVEYEMLNDVSKSAQAVERVLERDDIAVLILSQKVARACDELVREIKRKRSTPMIVELPCEGV